MMKFRSALIAVFFMLIARTVHADVVHQVRQGETLASISERYYGDSSREAMLVAANVLAAQANISLAPGMRIVIPSVSYYRVNAGDTWTRVAQRELGSSTRGPYLAQVNSANFMAMPSPGAVLRIPYLLRYVVLSDEPLFDIARRFYGDRAQAQFVLEFNHMSSSRLQRGQVLLLPLSDVVLRDEPVCENVSPLADANAAQREVDQQIPTLISLAAHGQYVEAIALGSRLAAVTTLSVAQRVTVDRALADAFCAVDRTDLAAEAFRDAIAVEHGLTLDERTTAPKVLDAFSLARGLGTLRSVAPAPPTARPESAH